MKSFPRRLAASLAGATLALTGTAVAGVTLATPAVAATPMVTTGTVNFRTGPSTSYAVLLVVPSGATVSATGTTSGSWTQVTYSGKTGWIYSSYLKGSSTSTATSTASASATGSATTTGNVNVRTGPGTSYSIVGVATTGTKVQTTGVTSGSWTQVIWSGATRWIFSSYLTGSTTSSPSSTTTTYSAPATDSRIQTVVNYALSKVGGPYLWGGSGPTSFDCSGLTMMSYAQIGVSLPHYSGSQATMGTAVSRANLKPGDLIFWYSPVSHVSLYIGNGEMVHARSTTYGIVRQSVDSYINAGGQYVGARRILN